jgi:outer membrane receptor protein involved in Fe transport
MIAGSAVALLPMPGYAQQSTPQDAQRLQEVVVTGSRFTRPLEEATAPLTIVGQTDIERSATDSIGKVLQALPLQSGLTQNTNDTFGDGSARINLHGLGAQRTLVLLNGRRFIFGGLGADTSVDLNTIPLAMIERVEIYAGGASSVYGSDAMAGVVNVITRTDFSGAELGGSYRSTERGDGTVRTAQALMGTPLGGAHLMLGLEYVDQRGVLQGERRYSAHVESLASPQGPVIHTGGYFSPQGTIIIVGDNALGLPPLDSFFYTHVTGTSGRGASDFRQYDKYTDLFNYAPYLYLQTPSKRGSAWLQARQELTDSLEWYAEGMFHRQRSQEGDEPASYSSFNTGAAPVDPATGAQRIPANNFYNPFGTDIVGVFRELVEAGPSTFVQHANTSRALIGLRGTLGYWHWDSSLTWARSETDFLLANQVLRAEVRQAVGPSGRDAAGHIVCGIPDPATGIVSTPDIIQGCVPLDLFGGQGADGLGTVTPEQLNYIARDLHTFGTNQHWLADLLLTGPFGHVPAGDLRWSLGAQYRRESASLALDPNFGEGIAGVIFLGVPQTSFTTREVFIEMTAPLLRDLPVAQAVDATLGARYSRFSAFENTTSLQGGLHWRVSSHLTLRGSYAQVFRAPGTSELFASQFEENRPIGDPCEGDPTPEQQVNCAKAGVPGGRREAVTQGPTRVVYGGNPQLSPESGDTWTAGVLLNGASRSGLRASLDYWHVRLDDAIGVSDPDSILSACVDSGSADACRLVARAADGSMRSIDARQINLSSQTIAGFDMTLGVSRQSGAGTFDATVSAVRLRTVKRKNFSAGEVTDQNGTFERAGISWPRWRVQGTLDWMLAPWRASYTARYIDSVTECGDRNFFLAFLAPTDCRKVGARLYHDVSATYRMASGLRMTGGIENLTDAKPPRVNLSYTANTDPTIHSVLGRAYTVGIQYEFR